MVKYSAEVLKTETEKLRNDWFRIGQIVNSSLKTGTYQPEEEKEFLSLKNTIAKQQRVLLQRISDKKAYNFSSVEISNMLKSQIVSLSQIIQYAESDKARIQQEWHRIFMRLSYVYGAFSFQAEQAANQPGFFEKLKRKFKKQ